MTADTVSLTNKQTQALHAARSALRAAPTEPFRIFGYAGTGKTTIARLLPEMVGASAIYAAFTGKACDVLQSKGCEGARTLHSLRYVPRKELHERKTDLVGRLDAATDPAQIRKLTAELAEVRRDIEKAGWVHRPEPFPPGSLVIVDEASMIKDDVARALLSHRPRLVVFGDPFQLPPVKGAGYLGEGVPDILLTEPHRFSLESRIGRLANDIRTAGSGLGIDPRRDADVFTATGEGALTSQILVGKNEDRRGIVRSIRDHLKRPAGKPVPGDSVMFIQNNPTIGVFNGQTVDVLDVSGGARDTVKITYRDPEGRPQSTRVLLKGFAGTKTAEDAAAEHGRSEYAAAATFAQALTVHKAQGSQWPRVLVSLRNPWSNGSATDRRRWLYTAVTRASDTIALWEGK